LFGEIKIGFYHIFGTSFSWKGDYCWAPTGFQTVVIDEGRRTETDGSEIYSISGALLRPGRALELLRFKEISTCENFMHTSGMISEWLPFKKK
jgi:hypothetical protein